MSFNDLIEDAYSRFIYQMLGYTPEQIAEAEAKTAAFRALPDEERERITADRKARRERDLAEIRARSTHVSLTTDRLLAALGISIPEATHYVQSYCECDLYGDDPFRCEHYKYDVPEGGRR